MNNYYTLHHLSKFLDDTLQSASLVSAISRKKRLLEFNFMVDGTGCQLMFHTANPPALFLQDGINDSKLNAAICFDIAWGKQLDEVYLDANDRILYLRLQDSFEVRCVAFGPGANAYLYRNGILVDQFRNACPPVGTRIYHKGDVPSVARCNTLKEKILVRDPRFPRQLINALAISLDLGQMDDAELCLMVDGLTDSMLSKPVYRRLGNNDICLLDDRHVPDAKASTFDDVNALARACWVQKEIRDKFTSRRNQMLADIETALRRLQSIIEGLENVKPSIERADHNEMIGHILMAHSYLSPPLSNTVELDDIYNPGGRINVKVKQGLSYSENAQIYYQKAKNSRRTLEANHERLLDAQQKLSLIASLRDSFHPIDGPRSYERWLKANERSISLLLPSHRSDARSSRPWRVIQLGKYDVWIGKSAAGNDEMLQASHKEDIWLHARHVSGSHVIIRMNKSQDFPPVDIIETAASWAAWYSKAKTSGTAPVIYTKRKHVRKPKGAAPGTALVDREQVCLVEPTKTPNSTSE